MSDSTATTDAFDIKVEDAGPARKRITITVPAATIEEKKQSSMGNLQAEAVLPGFRKGKAPKHLLERRFGSAMDDETIQTLVREGYAKAAEDNDFVALGDGEIDGGIENLKIEDGKPLTVVVEVDVVPDFELPDFSSFEIVRPLLEVEDEHIDAELGRQCLRAGKAERIEDGFLPTDRMLGSITVDAKGEDEPIFSHDQALVVLPEAGENGQVLGLVIPDMASIFASSKVGDTVTMNASGPDTHEREEFRGKDLTISYTIHLCERINPATQEELIEQFNLGSEDVLREQIRLALEQRRDEEQASVLRQQGLEKIVEAVDFELPEEFSGKQIQQEIDRTRHELMSSGNLDPDEVEVKMAEMRDDTETGIRRRLKAFFIQQRLANHFEVQVNENEINSRIVAVAMQRGLRPEHVRSELAKSGQLHTLGGQVRDDKATDAMVAQMTITDMPVDEWNALHAEGKAPSGAAKKKTSTKKTAKKASSKKAPAKKASSKKASTKKASTKKASTKKASKKKPS